MKCACEIDWGAVATFTAIIAALVTPYIADRIQHRRRRAAALQVAELALEAIRTETDLGRPMADSEFDQRMQDRLELDILAMATAMDRVPADHLGTALGVNAFIRLSAALRSYARLSDERKQTSNLDFIASGKLNSDLASIRVLAFERIQELRSALL